MRNVGSYEDTLEFKEQNSLDVNNTQQVRQPWFLALIVLLFGLVSLNIYQYNTNLQLQEREVDLRYALGLGQRAIIYLQSELTQARVDEAKSVVIGNIYQDSLEIERNKNSNLLIINSNLQGKNIYLQHELDVAGNDIVGLKQKLRDVRFQHDSLKQDLTIVNLKNVELIHQVDDLTLNTFALNDDIDALEDSIVYLEGERDRFEDNSTDLEDEVQDLKTTVSDLRNDVLSKEALIDRLEDKIDEKNECIDMFLRDFSDFWNPLTLFDLVFDSLNGCRD